MTDRFTPTDAEKANGMITKSARQCRICWSNADRYDNRFECQANPCHVADLNTGIFTDMTPPQELTGQPAKKGEE